VTEYQTYRHLLQQRLNERGLNVEVVNAAVGGNDTRAALARLETDVLAEQPALVIVMFGINDAAMVDNGPVARTEPRVPPADYVANLRTVIERVRASGAKVLLCTPTPMSRAYAYQDVGAYAEHEDINYLLREYAAAVRELAGELDIPLFDGFALLADRLDLIEDGNHPYARGHALLAEGMEGPVSRALGEEGTAGTDARSRSGRVPASVPNRPTSGTAPPRVRQHPACGPGAGA
jgi:lysophospholipase L1-like esterase